MRKPPRGGTRRPANSLSGLLRLHHFRRGLAGSRTASLGAVHHLQQTRHVEQVGGEFGLIGNRIAGIPICDDVAGTIGATLIFLA